MKEFETRSDYTVDSALDVARSEYVETPPAAVAARLDAAYLRERKRRRIRRIQTWTVAACAVLLCMAISLGQKGRPLHHLPLSNSAGRTSANFLAIPYAPPLLASEQLDVCRVELAPAAVAQFGLPVPPATANGVVTADLVVGSDGAPRAIRFVR
jgi:hypothetical protein